MAGHVDVRYTSERCYIQGQKLNIWGEERLYKILIVEDDETIAGGLKNHLEKWNYQAECMTDFKDVMGKFVEFEPQLVLLDIVLPFFNGFHWCQEIRKISKVPIIFLSSANDNMNIVMAMNMGADDFISKPFDGMVLIAKVQALLRRVYDFAASVPVLEYRGAFLNTGDDTLSFNGRSIPLSKNEYRILLCLMENRGKIVSRERLMERLWKTQQFVDENTLTVNINRLRKKLDAAGLTDFITTKVGLGYLVE